MSVNFQRASLVSGDGRSAHDTSTEALIILDHGEHEVHEGNAYFGIHSALKEDAGLIEALIITPDTTKWLHLKVKMEAALAATVEIWEATTKTDVPGQRFVLNKDRNSSNGTGALVCHTPGGSEAEPPQIQHYIGASTSGGRSDTGGAAQGELILKQNTAYLLRVTSRANSNALAIILDYSEHINQGA